MSKRTRWGRREKEQARCTWPYAITTSKSLFGYPKIYENEIKKNKNEMQTLGFSNLNLLFGDFHYAKAMITLK